MDSFIIRLIKKEREERKWLKSSQFVMCNCEGISDYCKFKICLGYIHVRKTDDGAYGGVYISWMAKEDNNTYSYLR